MRIDDLCASQDDVVLGDFPLHLFGAEKFDEVRHIFGIFGALEADNGGAAGHGVASGIAAGRIDRRPFEIVADLVLERIDHPVTGQIGHDIAVDEFVAHVLVLRTAGRTPHFLGEAAILRP